MPLKCNLMISITALIVTACNQSAPVSEPISTPQSVETHERATSEDHQADDKHTDTHEAAENHSDNAMRQADSHVHGGANLAMALDRGTLTVELDSPLYNLTGFEHAPETSEQEAVIEKTEMQLSHPETLFVFNTAANCTANAIDVHLGFEDHHKEDDHEDEAHDDHDEGHRDVSISYTFDCQAPDKLSSVDVKLLGYFPNMTDIEVVYLGPNIQTQAELGPRKTRFNLSE